MSLPNTITSIADIITLMQASFADWQQFGHVTVRRKHDLLLFNYNTMAQYSEEWTFFERVSRGLIIDHRTGEIVARPFDKFFNWGEGGRTTSAPLVSVMEKMDGSLGILYRTESDCQIATRGSFDGEQALWATDFLQNNYNLMGLPTELTLLFEIIYPGNRVVVDYGKHEDLVLLAARDRFTGKYWSSDEVQKIGTTYGFSLPKRYSFTDVEALIATAKNLDINHEGYVAEFADGQRFKFKSLRYLALHKLIVSLTFKNILAAMQAGTIEHILETVPDEFLDETRQWISEIDATMADVKQQVATAFDAAPKTSRKDFALWVQQHHPKLKRYLFALLDERNLEPLIYRHHKWQ